MNENPIKVVASLSKHRDANLVYATLPNGKEILTHLSKDLSLDLNSLPLGTSLTLEMTTFDFEKGRIVEAIPPSEPS